MGKASVDNLDCLDGELDFSDMNLFDSLALELGSSSGEFDMVEL